MLALKLRRIMRRREFISLLGGAAATWPLTAQAQQSGMPVIGLLDARSPDAIADRLRGFRQGLKETGYVEGERGDRVPFRREWKRSAAGAGGRSGRQQVAVIATAGDDVSYNGQGGNNDDPIVFLASQDPVRLGLVASLARPDGNLTGINFFSGNLIAKRLELLRELVPGAARLAVLVNPANAAQTETTLRELQPAADAMRCRSRSSTPARARRSMRPSRRLCASGPTRFSSAVTPFSLAGASK